MAKYRPWGGRELKWSGGVSDSFPLAFIKGTDE